MAVQVKCKICGKKIDKPMAFKVSGEKINQFFCSEEEYMIREKENRAKDRIYMCIEEIFDRKVTNSALFKEMAEILKIYGVHTVFDYLSEEKENIIVNMQKDFSSEYAQIRYFAAILKNNLTDYKKCKDNDVVKKEILIENSTQDIMNVKYKAKSGRKCLCDLDI